jgi:sterol desaturase/sphingolipid hydroxylase (fatty acid hydroxylase superfamily)
MMSMLQATADLAPKDTLSDLLFVETLVFAVFGLSFSFPQSELARTKNVALGRRFALWSAVIVSLLAIGAVISWCELALENWPGDFSEWFPLVMLAVGIIAQPAFAWWVVRALF